MAAYQYIYVMKGLNKTYPGGRQVLKDIWLSFLPGAKIGVLGLNGAGKSTLLRIMAGQDDNFTGEAWAAEGAKVGFLEQEPKLDPKKDVWATSWTAPARWPACWRASRRSRTPSPTPTPTWTS
jgi:ATPase subunit of ABC transporter with duplicated ATPase domains